MDVSFFGAHGHVPRRVALLLAEVAGILPRCEHTLGRPEAYCHRAVLDAIRYLVDGCLAEIGLAIRAP
ncbi:hypothetical protein ABZ646_39925 [Streptomyces sp. NPDC007162]|uniref:hypothetical protein n=1 Tax=Streptomyces sp. NPDC007162 TaxID=3156917 RepID=UPI0033F1E3A3